MYTFNERVLVENMTSLITFHSDFLKYTIAYHTINDTRLIPQLLRRILWGDSPNHKEGLAITINSSGLFRENNIDINQQKL